MPKFVQCVNHATCDKVHCPHKRVHLKSLTCDNPCMYQRPRDNTYFCLEGYSETPKEGPRLPSYSDVYPFPEEVQG
jgi:hypothetical protein